LRVGLSSVSWGGLSSPEEIAKQKQRYLLYPDSIFDDFGLVEITTTSSKTSFIETSESNKGG
jgi:hypothetical protein